MLKENTIHLGDCLDLMPSIPSKSVDMILCDLPYGTTACEWDSIIDMYRLWAEYERVIKDNGAIVLTANSHFVFTLHASNPKIYRYNWIWIKSKAANFLQAQKAPLRKHEFVLVFYKKMPSYNPQKYIAEAYNKGKRKASQTDAFSAFNPTIVKSDGERFPTDIIYFPTAESEGLESLSHPTQKPVALFEYLIKTYTNENDLVLDNCSGSGTTAIACMNTNRRFICMEKDETYHRKSLERLANHEPLFHLPT